MLYKLFNFLLFLGALLGHNEHKLLHACHIVFSNL